MENKNYRPDIDGLRAIAVLAVLFYHTDIPGFSGGFVGVDIFFVISGYLITSIILRDIKQGTFSIAQFYERRIRRIFPALFTVMAVTIIIGAFLLDKDVFKDLGQSVIATTFFSSNIWFWSESGYFAAPSLQKPLLHTWSLAVEEQYYILFPLALLFINRHLKGRYLTCIIVITVLSLVTSIYGVYHHPDATFYLVFTRAWELLLGAVLAFGKIPKTYSNIWRNILSFIGLFLIMFSIVFYTDKIRFPGHFAIFPVVGTFIVIYCQHSGGTIVNKALSFRPLVAIGLISYSLYLWHWPFITFSKYMMFKPLSSYDKAWIIVLSLALSFGTWRYVEQPFRYNSGYFRSRKKIFICALFTMSMTVVTGLIIYLNNGMSWRHPMSSIILDQGQWDWYQDSKYGKIELDSDNLIPGKCGSKDEIESFILWGDSHAMSLIPGCDISARKFGKSGFIATHSSCPPLLGFELDVTPYRESIHNANVLEFISNHPEIKKVLLAASWSEYISGEYSVHKDNINLAEKGLIETVHNLLKMDREVIIFSDYPLIKNYDYTVRAYYLQSRYPMLYNLDDIIDSPTVSDYNTLNKDVLPILYKTGLHPNVEIIHIESLFFDNREQFISSIDEIPLYRDAGHLSTFGSQYITLIFDQIFSNKLFKP